MATRGVIVLVRHGQTSWSLTGRHTSRTNVALTAEGRAQAERLAPFFERRAISEVRTSPLDRAIETCALTGLGRRAIVDEDLREWEYGADEGVTTDEIRVSRPGWTVWRDGPLGGESIDDVARRVDRVIERARLAARAGDVVLVGHGHCLRVLAARWLAMDPRLGRGLALDAGSLSELGFEREQPVILTWNRVPREHTP